MTLHQRVQVFYSKDRFRFQPYAMNKMGVRLKAEWDRITKNSPLPVVESVEESGTFQVFNYPESFVTLMDQLIKVSKTDILQAAKKKKLSKEAKTKPLQEVNQKDDKPRRKRIAKPVYSSRQ
jgi:hypothetical protein